MQPIWNDMYQGRLNIVKLRGSPIVIIVILIIIKHRFGKIYIYGIIFSNFFLLFSSKLGGQHTR